MRIQPFAKPWLARTLTLLTLISLAGAAVSSCAAEPASPSEVAGALIEALEAEEYGAVYDLLSVETQLRLDEALQAAAERLPETEETEEVYGATPPELAELSGRELFVLLASTTPPGERTPFVPGNGESATDEGEDDATEEDEAPTVELVDGPTYDDTGTRADITLRLPDGDEYDVRLVQEEGRWAVDATTYCGTLPGGQHVGGTSPVIAGLVVVVLAWLLSLARQRQRGSGRWRRVPRPRASSHE